MKNKKSEAPIEFEIVDEGTNVEDEDNEVENEETDNESEEELAIGYRVVEAEVEAHRDEYHQILQVKEVA